CAAEIAAAAPAGPPPTIATSTFDIIFGAQRAWRQEVGRRDERPGSTAAIDAIASSCGGKRRDRWRADTQRPWAPDSDLERGPWSVAACDQNPRIRKYNPLPKAKHPRGRVRQPSPQS